jgi:glycine oxidase
VKIPRPQSSPLAVLGGGIVGLCVARRLARLGCSVQLIEKIRVGAGASGAAAGIIAAPLRRCSPYQKSQWASYQGYPAFIEELCHETALEIEFIQSGMLYLAMDSDEETDQRKKVQRLDDEALTVRWYEGGEIREENPSMASAVRGGIFMEETARVHPPDLLEALKNSFLSRGGILREGFQKVELGERMGDSTTDELILEDSCGNREIIRDHRLIICAGAWTQEILESAGIKLEAAIVPIRGQMVEFHCQVPLPYMLDVASVYIIPRPDSRIWVGATVEEAGFAVDVTEEDTLLLLESARLALPFLKHSDMIRAWAGLRPKTLRRGGALLGNAHAMGRDIWYVAGHYRNGIQLGPRDADLVVGKILGMDPREFSPFFR